MAITNGYTTQALVKTRLGIGDTADDTAIDAAATAASRLIDSHCRRRFYADGAATARVFYAEQDWRGRSVVAVDDISTSTGLVVKTDTSDDATFDTTWAASDYQLEPLNGVVDGLEGWPYTRIVAVEARRFPMSGKRARVEVTADWGWAAVPAAVSEACLILSARLFQRKDSPLGFAAGGEFEAVRLSRIDADVPGLLAPFVRPTEVRRR